MRDKKSESERMAVGGGAKKGASRPALYTRAAVPPQNQCTLYGAHPRVSSSGVPELHEARRGREPRSRRRVRKVA